MLAETHTYKRGVRFVLYALELFSWGATGWSRHLKSQASAITEKKLSMLKKCIEDINFSCKAVYRALAYALLSGKSCK